MRRYVPTLMAVFIGCSDNLTLPPDRDGYQGSQNQTLNCLPDLDDVISADAHFLAVTAGEEGNKRGMLRKPAKAFATHGAEVWVASQTTEGTATTVYAACAPALEGESGLWLEDCNIFLPSDAALDDEAAEILWQLSEQIWKPKE